MKGVLCEKKDCKWNEYVEESNYGYCNLDSIFVDENGSCECMEEEE